MSSTRRSCQTVLVAQLLSVSRVLSPILPHLAEDVWQNLPFPFTTAEGHAANFVFESGWPASNERHLAFPEEDVIFWGKILELRNEVNKVLEVARTKKLIGSSLEAKAYLYASDHDLVSRLVSLCSSDNEADTLHRIFLTSQVEILGNIDDVKEDDISCTGEYLIDDTSKVWIGVSRADGSKCERCWNFSPQVGSYDDHPSLCSRCHCVVSHPIPALAAAS